MSELRPIRPDILDCLANLSSDEVFTPPKIVNAMLDLLPSELWSNPKARFCDPFTKSGIFLREIVKRLDKGLVDIIPNKEERINHIFKNQVFGIAITQLTAIFARRTLYCNKDVTNERSTIKDVFKSNDGNILYHPCKHTWVNGSCKICGASQKALRESKEVENYAYPFLHDEAIMKQAQELGFDVVIGNPPYQMSFGIEGTNKSNSQQIYNLFMDAAFKLQPHYVVMITKSGWLTKTAQGIPEKWISNQLNSNKFRVMHDFIDSKECFSGVTIKGGVNYFLWDKLYHGPCEYYLHSNGEVYKRSDNLNTLDSGILIRDAMATEILGKLVTLEGEYYKDAGTNFSGIVSPKHYFDDSGYLTSNWRGFVEEKDAKHYIKYYLNKSMFKIPYGWISIDDVPKNRQTIRLHKVYIPAAGGSGNDDQVIGRPFYGEPGSVCSQTYLVIGYDGKNPVTKRQCNNMITYIRTRFFRYLVSIKKKTQNGPRGVYQFVPMQDFSKPWTDEELYKKYKLTKDEIEFIESMIRPMDDKEAK